MQCVMEYLINIVSQDVAAIPQSTKIELSGLYLSLCAYHCYVRPPPPPPPGHWEGFDLY